MNRNIQSRAGVIVAVLVFLSLACSSQVSFSETESPVNAETLVAQTMAVYTQKAPVVTSTFAPTVTEIPASPTAESFGEVYVYTVVDNVNLRVQPGTLFQVSRVMPNNTRLLLLGVSPGGEWLYVRNDEEVFGWVNVNVVKGGYDGPPPPVVEPGDVFLITGRVTTELGTPVSGIGFAVLQGSLRADVMTDATGQFYAFIPRTLGGTWSVEQVSVSCTSNTMDATCNCINNQCGSAFPASMLVDLPQKGILEFVWK